MAANGLDLVVSVGPDAGRRLALRPGVWLVGRAREADLALTDLTVSRRHLEIHVADGRVIARPCAGAEVAGAVDARLEIGAQLRVGDTTLTLVPATEIVESPCEISEVATLLGAKTEDARGFAAIFALTETLDAADGRVALDRALADWAARYLDAGSARLTTDGEPAAHPAHVVTDFESATLSVPIPGHGTLVVEMERCGSRGPRADQQRRLAIVAARVCASALTRLSRQRRLEEERETLRTLALGSARAFLGDSPKAREIARLVPKLAASDSSLLILGETGSGKSFVARLVHDASARASAPFRQVNCASLPDALVEAELFGHERGAFTGAAGARAGAFEAVGDGTLFLDEIGELPLSSQAKLLRALDEKRFERLGSNRSLTLRARVIAATNRSLADMVADGRFRADLFYRLSVVTLEIAPLRERRQDLPLLARQVLADLATSGGRRVDGFSEATLAALGAYGWPGNVRELRNVLERALVLGDGPLIEPSDLPDVVRGTARSIPAEADVVRLPARLDQLEERAIQAALAATGGNRTRAAALLGINRVTLYKKLREDR